MTVGAALARITVRRVGNDPRAVAAAAVALEFGGRKVRLRGFWIEKTGTVFKWRAPTALVPGDAERCDSFVLDDGTARQVELLGLQTWERLRLEVTRHSTSAEVALPAVGVSGERRPRGREPEWELERWA